MKPNVKYDIVDHFGLAFPRLPLACGYTLTSYLRRRLPPQSASRVNQHLLLLVVIDEQARDRVQAIESHYLSPVSIPPHVVSSHRLRLDNMPVNLNAPPSTLASHYKHYLIQYGCDHKVHQRSEEVRCQSAECGVSEAHPANCPNCTHTRAFECVFAFASARSSADLSRLTCFRSSTLDPRFGRRRSPTLQSSGTNHRGDEVNPVQELRKNAKSLSYVFGHERRSFASSIYSCHSQFAVH